MDAKKYPALTATLVVFGLIALTGVVLAGIEYAGYSGQSDKLTADDRKVKQLLADPIAPTEENQKAAADNLAALKIAETSHLTDLKGVKADEFSKDLVTDPGQFTANLTASVTNWRKLLGDVGVTLIPGRAGVKTEDFAFGFSRYYKTGVNPSVRVTQDLSRQSRIVDFMVRTLSEVKAGDVVKLVSVDREPIELAAGVKTQIADEITGMSDSVFHRDGIVTGQFFRIRFIGSTDVLRRFINAIAGSGRPLVVRGVEVAPATPEQLATQQDGADVNAGAGAIAPGANIFGDAAPAAGATPAGAADAAAPVGSQIVVQGSPSDITVTLEFVEPSKAEPAKPAEGAEGAPVETAKQ